MELSLQTLVRELETWLRHGQGGKARDELAKLDVKHLPRQYAASIAMLARRSDFSDLAISILHPLEKRNAQEAAEYGAALSYVGATSEALQVLEQIDTAEAPQALLYTAYAHIAQWDYHSAIDLLTRYVKIPEIEEYRLLVGHINLAAALVHEGYHEPAEILLDELLESTHTREYAFHRAKTIELLAENALRQGRWEQAQRFLFESNALNRGAAPIQRLFLRKWRAVLALKKSTDRSALANVRQLASNLGHYETLRDCDQHEAQALKDQALLWKVYFGTPFAAFRVTLLREFETELSIPEHYDWTLGEGKAKSVLPIDELLRDPRARLLRALTSDFYGASLIPTLAFQLDPDSPFHPVHTPQLVREALSDLENWIEDKQLPLKVAERGGRYRLTATSDVTFRLGALAPPMRRAA